MWAYKPHCSKSLCIPRNIPIDIHSTIGSVPCKHDDVIKWKHFLRHWPFVRVQRPVTRSFDVFFDLRLNKRLSKRSWGWWFETLSRALWRRRNEYRLTSHTVQADRDWNGAKGTQFSAHFKQQLVFFLCRHIDSIWYHSKSTDTHLGKHNIETYSVHVQHNDKLGAIVSDTKE